MMSENDDKEDIYKALIKKDVLNYEGFKKHIDAEGSPLDYKGSLEDLLDALKEECHENGISIPRSDEFIAVNDARYVENLEDQIAMLTWKIFVHEERNVKIGIVIKNNEI